MSRRWGIWFPMEGGWGNEYLLNNQPMYSTNQHNPPFGPQIVSIFPHAKRTHPITLLKSQYQSQNPGPHVVGMKGQNPKSTYGLNATPFDQLICELKTQVVCPHTRNTQLWNLDRIVLFFKVIYNSHWSIEILEPCRAIVVRSSNWLGNLNDRLLTALAPKRAKIRYLL